MKAIALFMAAGALESQNQEARNLTRGEGIGILKKAVDSHHVREVRLSRADRVDIWRWSRHGRNLGVLLSVGEVLFVPFFVLALTKKRP